MTSPIPTSNEDPRWREDPIWRAKAALVTRWMRERSGTDGFPFFVSIRVGGKRIWKSVGQLTVEDYIQVVDYFRKRGTLKRAEAYRARAKERFRIEIPDSPASN